MQSLDDQVVTLCLLVTVRTLHHNTALGANEGQRAHEAGQDNAAAKKIREREEEECKGKVGRR